MLQMRRGEPLVAPYAIGDQFFLQCQLGKLPWGTFVTIRSLTLAEDGWTVVVSGLLKKGQDEIEMVLPKNHVDYLGDTLPEGYRKSA